MLTIGCHLSSAKGYEAMAKEAEKIKANTFQFFTRNPRGGKAKEINPQDVENFHQRAKEMGIQKILAHAPYTLNACSKEERVREFAFQTMKDDLERMEYTPGNCYNFHPGSHVGQGTEKVNIFLQYPATHMPECFLRCSVLLLLLLHLRLFRQMPS